MPRPITHLTARRHRPLWRGLALLALLAATGTALAALEPFSLGGRHLLPAGELYTGSVTLIGGELTIAEGARVEGAVTLLGGRLRLDGTVAGTVHAYGASVSLGERSVVEGSIAALAADVERAPGAVVRGRIERDRVASVSIAELRGWTASLGRFGGEAFALSVLVQAGLLALLAFVLAPLMPSRLERIAGDAVDAPVAAGVSGLVAAVVAVVAIVVSAVTLIGIPLAVLIGVLVGLAVLLGLVALAQRVGDVTWRDGASAGARAALGGFLVGLGWAALGAVPLIGGPVRSVVGVVMLGAVVRSRGGGQGPDPSPAHLDGGGPRAAAG